MGRLFLSNALPMIVVMSMGGLLNLVDAAFLGHFVGADALAAVSIVFPAVMISIALSTLVNGGMSSLLARHLGAGERDQAAAVFARAHGQTLC
ncbi:MAG: MATE family efflux transporter, partial [Allgaiera sp.]|nr:MATE family efflux transporter [Allgaiera sp.]